MEILWVPSVAVLLLQLSPVARAYEPLNRSLTTGLRPQSVSLCPRTKRGSSCVGLGMLARHMSPGWRLGMNSRRDVEERLGVATGVWEMATWEGERERHQL